MVYYLSLAEVVVFCSDGIFLVIANYGFVGGDVFV